MFDWFESLFKSITSLPQEIGNTLKVYFIDLTDVITDIPEFVLNGIKSIFIPDAAAIQDRFNEFLDDLKFKFNFDTEFFQNVVVDGRPVDDVEEDYYISGVGTLKLKFFDTSYFVQGVEYFRPFIRGFIVLLMMFYHVKQILSFIRQDAGVITGKAVEYSENAKKEK